MKAAVPEDKRALEVTSWQLGRHMRRRTWDSPEQAEAHFKELLRKNEGKIPDLPPATPAEQAQLMMYGAFAESAPRKRIAMARKALKLSPDCADAYVLLAEEEAKTPPERVALYREGVLAGERLLGDKFLDEHLGELWAMGEARGFLRARLGLGEALWENGMPEESVTEYRMLLVLDRGDHQGVRYMLAPLLVCAGLHAEALKLMDRREFAEDMASVWLYTRALLTFAMMGDIHAARVDLEKALDTDREVGLGLAGVGELPPGPYSKEQVDDMADVVETALELEPYWKAVPGALPWLRGMLKG